MPRESYGSFVAYVLGYDDALEGALLLGFREWATMRWNQQANLEWSAVILGLLTGDPRNELNSEQDNRSAVAGAFRLISSFVEERGDDPSAIRIF